MLIVIVTKQFLAHCVEWTGLLWKTKNIQRWRYVSRQCKVKSHEYWLAAWNEISFLVFLCTYLNIIMFKSKILSAIEWTLFNNIRCICLAFQKLILKNNLKVHVWKKDTSQLILSNGNGIFKIEIKCHNL